jgi:hypothetical protein
MPLAPEKIKETYKVELEKSMNLITVTFLPPAYSDSADIELRAEMISQGCFNYFNQYPDEKFNLVINLIPLGKSGRVSSKARKTYAKLLGDKHFNKIAFAGGNTFLKVVVDFIAIAAGIKSRFKWGLTLEKAREWVNKNK